MVIESANGFFELRVGSYHFAMPTRTVVAVVDYTMDRDLAFRGRPLRLIDMRALFATRHDENVPFVLIVEAGRGSWLGIGVDGVGTAPIADTVPILRLPAVGLERPNLFRGVMRWQDRLVLVLDLEEVAKTLS